MTPKEVFDTPVCNGGIMSFMDDGDVIRRRCDIHAMAYAVAVAELNRVSVVHMDGGWFTNDGDPRPERTGRGDSFVAAMRDWCHRNQVEFATYGQ